MSRSFPLCSTGRFHGETSERLDEILAKLQKKDPRTKEMVSKKMDEIVQNPERYERLTNFEGIRRAHVGTNNVLFYKINYPSNSVLFTDFGGYDQMYDR
ncbi:MAG: type II toxin-antitoxin system mRNA interferase toxin, RelE/StbE family [Candidatus Parvarchaeota archaeon]|jgi:mRNA-degrading endonuclease RelE of RelBE toxin-antitoxin system|nr:type II toxin-antitoxin system mRNA interferase toxin, RelE/StbE family [Candidatus Parvarchaeota archaeon]MCL5101622.1 type II toxin-antitoxin system mRNA interferase toxin, RelE/StbE family [Candidatus Parvarchaeota archaeon]